MSFNFFDNIPPDMPQELFETVLEAGKVKIERIVSKGHVSEPGFWYDQEMSEWIMLLQGEAEVEFSDKKVRLHKGDCLFIEKHRKHRVSFTSAQPDAIWLAVFIED